MDNIRPATDKPFVVPFWISMSASLLNVIVVEDDAESRTLVSEMLTMMGHKVHAVSTAEDALAILQNQQFDVLLTDINLPGKSGIELAQDAVDIMPSLKVIFVSGFGYLVADNDRVTFDFLLLSKPYSLARLEEAITRLSALISKFKQASVA